MAEIISTPAGTTATERLLRQVSIQDSSAAPEVKQHELKNVASVACAAFQRKQVVAALQTVCRTFLAPMGAAPGWQSS